MLASGKLPREWRSKGLLSALGRRFGLILPVTWVLSAGTASAQPSSENVSVSLALEAEPNCVARERLQASVRARTRRVEFVTSAPNIPSLRVRVSSANAQGIAIELQVTRPPGRQSVRWLRAKNCEEALEAAALVIAITFDAQAKVEALPVSADATNDSATGSNADDAAERNRRSADAADPSSATSDASQPKATAAPDQHIGESEPTLDAPLAISAAPPFELRAGVAGQALWGAAPGLLPGFSLFVSLGSERNGFSPAVRAAFTHYFPISTREAGGTGEFGAEAFQLDLCPFGLHARPFALRACAEGLVSVLLAQGKDTFSPRERARPFLVLGGSLAGELTLSRRLALHAAFGAGKNLQRDTFAFSPTVFYRVPSVSWQAAAGIALRFP